MVYVNVMLLIFCIFSVVKTIFHAEAMVKNITGKYSNYLGLLILFMPGSFNEKGNSHRKALFLWSFISGVLIIILINQKQKGLESLS